MVRASICLFLGLSIALNARGQGKFNFEIAAGLSHNWLQTSPPMTSNNYRIETINPIQFNGGLNGLFRISPSWQIAAETEFAKVPFNVMLTRPQPNGSFTTKSITKVNLTNFRAGIRYSINQPRISYYFQPTLGIVLSSNRFNYDSDSTLSSPSELQNINPFGFTAKAELGIKVLEGRSNYLVFGIRHQTGFVELDKRISANEINPASDMSISSSGSYSSVFLGIGFTPKKTTGKSSNRVTKERKVLNELLDKNGGYASLVAGVRLHEPGYSFPSFAHFGTLNILIGHKVNNFFGEVGLVITGANATYQIDHDGHKGLILQSEPYTIRSIPATLKYATPISKRKLCKLGVSFTANYIVSGDYYGGSGGGSGSRTINGTLYTYTGKYIKDAMEPRKTFFNAGLYVEKVIFNLGFIDFKLSGNFGSDVHRRISASYNIDGTQYDVTAESRLNGFLAEFGFRLPFAVLSKRQKKQQEAILDLQ